MTDAILTVAQMRKAEQALIRAGISVDELMQRAGRGAAEWVWRMAAGRSVTVLCGPGNNGGDGYVIAETLRERGLSVHLVAPVEPATDAARAARAQWRGDVSVVGERARGAILVDCLFGSGLTRPLSRDHSQLLTDLAGRHDLAVAVDLPSGVDSDTGGTFGVILPQYAATLALGAWKFAHWLMPAAASMGTRLLIDIGTGDLAGAARLLGHPELAVPATDAHKYTRGLVAVVGGPMKGAALLACLGAMRGGAGAVRLLASDLHPAAPPDIVLRPEPVDESVGDPRIGAVLAGPGLGRDDAAHERLRIVLASGRAGVLDADALSILTPADLEGFQGPLVLTPHEGELDRLAGAFSLQAESKIARARELARRARAVVVAKGPDTIIAAPDGDTVLAPSATSWLSVAGSGDVLAGIVAARLAATGDPLRAACEGHALHGKAAALSEPCFPRERPGGARLSGIRGLSVSEGETIVRVAAKGDGVTAEGRHVLLAAPGDVVLNDGSLEPGPHRAVPPCRHFPRCGGCQLQHLDETALARFVTDRVVLAVQGQGVVPEKVREPHLSPPRSRRRATLHAAGGKGRPQIGFREAGSHRIVDMTECHVLRPELFALVAPLRAMFAARRGRWAADVDLAMTDQGVDCGLRNLEIEGLEQTEAVLDFARANRLARLTFDMGYGPEAVWEPEPVTVTLGGVPVPMPSGAFLQATADGEASLVSAARDWLGGCGEVADLFSGLGTFAFALAGPSRVAAYEAAREACIAARSSAARAGLPLEVVHRDLFRNPLRPEELARFDGVLLDPPRAGAREQVGQIAASAVQRVVYISCNPASWSRDARQLVDAGFSLRELRPVGQFRWSTHVELASLFVR